MRSKFDILADGGTATTKDDTVAKEILRQLGGAGKLTMMTGAYNFANIGNGLSFRIKNPRANYIKIKLTSMDLYDVEVGRIRGNDYKVVAEQSGLYNDMLVPFIEKSTGMYLSMNSSTRFERGGGISMDVINETEVSNDLGDMYLVKVWSNGWQIVSKHKFKADANMIALMIRDGANRDEVKKEIAELNKNGLSEYKGDYSLNWKSVKADKYKMKKMLREEDELTGESEGERRAGLDEFADGGSIEIGNSYGDKTPEEAWNNLTQAQRSHFMLDHSDVIAEEKEMTIGLPMTFVVEQHSKSWDKLDASVKRAFENHVNFGGYKKGGLVKRKRFAVGGDVSNFNGLKEEDFVWNAVGNKLIVDKVTDDEYYLESFGQAAPSPFGKKKVDDYIKSGEWTLTPKFSGGGDVDDDEYEEDDDNDDDDGIDYNNLSQVESELNRLTRWKYQYNSAGADGQIRQLTERVKYLKSQKPDKKFAAGGHVKHYGKDEHYRMSRPGGSIEKDILSKVQYSPEDFVGNFGWKTPQGKLGEGFLYRLDDYDKKLVSHIKLKKGEKIFRYFNRTSAIGGMKPLIKINIDRELLYWLVESEGDTIEFETKGTQALWIGLRSDIEYAHGGEVGYTRFDRHANMSSETREEILDIVSDVDDFQLKNKLYGLFDGYLYDDILENAKNQPTDVYDKICEIVEEVKSYPVETYADGGVAGGKYGSICYEVVRTKKDNPKYEIIAKYPDFDSYAKAKENRKPFVDSSDWRLDMIMYNLTSFDKKNLLEFIPNEKLGVIYDKYERGGVTIKRAKYDLPSFKTGGVVSEETKKAAKIWNSKNDLDRARDLNRIAHMTDYELGAKDKDWNELDKGLQSALAKQYESRNRYDVGGEVDTPEEGDSVVGYGHKYATSIKEVDKKSRKFKIKNGDYWDAADSWHSFDEVELRNGEWSKKRKFADGGETSTVTSDDVVPGAMFRNPDGVIFIVDDVRSDDTFGTLVESSFKGGKKGNYRNSLSDFVDFMNEEKVVKVMENGGTAYDMLLYREHIGEEAFKAMTPEERVEGARIFNLADKMNNYDGDDINAYFEANGYTVDELEAASGYMAKGGAVKSNKVKYTFNAFKYKPNERGSMEVSEKKTFSITASNQSTAEDNAHKKYPYPWVIELNSSDKFANGGVLRSIKGGNFAEQIENGRKFKELIQKVYDAQTDYKYPVEFIREIARSKSSIVKHDGKNYVKGYSYMGTMSYFEFLDDPNFVEALKYVDRPSIRKFNDGGTTGREKYWIDDAIEHKGALRKHAKREGLIEGDEKLSKADLKKLEAEGGKTAKRAYLASTLRGFKKKG